MTGPLTVLLVVQPSVSHYRAPFIRALLNQTDIEYDLVGRVRRVTGDPMAASDGILSRVTEIRRAELFRALHWDRGLVSAVWRTEAVAIVIEGNVYGISNWIAIAAARIRRRKVVFWGHAWKRPESGIKLALRRFFYRRADGHLTYGEWAQKFAGSVGLDESTFVPVFNSIYPNEIVRAQKARNRRRSTDGTLSLIYSGRLTPRHRVHQVIEAVCALNEEGYDVRLGVVGDGAESKRLEELARGSTNIGFFGAVYDPVALNRLYDEADFAVSPGATGLNVIQALGFGVPVIAASGDPQNGPEIEAVMNGVNGTLYSSHEALEGLKRVLVESSTMNDDDYAGQSNAALEIAASRYTSEAHADAVTAAMLSLIERTQ